MNDFSLTILDAFGERRRPISIIESKQLSDHEIAEFSAFGSLSWNEVNGDLWHQHFDIVSFLSPEAFCYFLPGVLKASFEENEPNLIVVSSIINMLDRSAQPEWWDEFFLARWSLLTIPEGEVIQAWLFWLSTLKNRSYSDESLERASMTLSLLKNNT